MDAAGPAAMVTGAAKAAPGGDAPSTPADQFGLAGRTAPGIGTEVITVAAGSAAARAGLQRGDLILAADGDKAPDAATLERRFRTAAAGSALLLTVQRGDRYRVIALEKR